MSRRDDDWVLISATVVHITDKAILLDVDDDGEKWIPKSQVRDADVLDVGLSDVIEIKRWFADKQNWDY